RGWYQFGRSKRLSQPVEIQRRKAAAVILGLGCLSRAAAVVNVQQDQFAQQQGVASRIGTIQTVLDRDRRPGTPGGFKAVTDLVDPPPLRRRLSTDVVTCGVIHALHRWLLSLCQPNVRSQVRPGAGNQPWCWAKKPASRSDTQTACRYGKTRAC